MNLNEQKGDLFDLDEKYNLAHCISLDCNMGAGIAETFNKKFPKMKGKLLSIILYNKLNYPITLVHNDKNREIFNLVTKKFYFHKPTYSSIEECIEQLSKYCKDNKVQYLGLPKIGCGLDRLKWNIIREIIIEQFKDLDIDIQVRYK